MKLVNKKSIRRKSPRIKSIRRKPSRTKSTRRKSSRMKSIRSFSKKKNRTNKRVRNNQRSKNIKNMRGGERTNKAVYGIGKPFALALGLGSAVASGNQPHRADALVDPSASPGPAEGAAVTESPSGRDWNTEYEGALRDAKQERERVRKMGGWDYAKHLLGARSSQLLPDTEAFSNFPALPSWR